MTKSTQKCQAKQIKPSKIVVEYYLEWFLNRTALSDLEKNEE